MILEAPDLRAAALDYAARGWEIFPLNGKVPLIPRRLGGRGLLDATTDTITIRNWWDRWPNANIGARVHPALFVVDTDPRNGGNLADLEAAHGPLGETVTAYSGRGDGGSHRYFWHPGGKLTARRLPAGIDLKLPGVGYTVVPPSVHPDTGWPYLWADPRAPIGEPPAWLTALLREAPPAPRPSRRSLPRVGDSIADDYCTHTSWRDLLEHHDWRLVSGDGDQDGSSWRRPGKSDGISATVRHGCLFVYSSSTPFDPTTPSAPNGYTKFRAYALLEHGGDMRAAAHNLKGVRA